MPLPQQALKKFQALQALQTKQPKNLQKANSKATLKPGAITTASIIITKK